MKFRMQAIIIIFALIFPVVLQGKNNEERDSGDIALKKLVKGNNLFVRDEPRNKNFSAKKRITLLKDGQHPYATVLSCSDSRVPVELIFDQGLGDVFVVRAAGNVVDDIGIGSIEYGVEHIGTPLLVILGHQACGAMKAAVSAKEKPGGFIGAVIGKILPVVEKVKAEHKEMKDEDLLVVATKENVKNVRDDLLKKSNIVAELVKEGKLKIVLGIYNLDSGKVDFFE